MTVVIATDLGRHIVAVWVAPQARGNGVIDALIDAVGRLGPGSGRHRARAVRRGRQRTSPSAPMRGCGFQLVPGAPSRCPGAPARSSSR